jgi:hypothetical protein
VVGAATRSRVGTCARVGTNSGLGSSATALARGMVGTARSRLGTCAGLGSTAASLASAVETAASSGLGSSAAAQAPLGLLVASRSSSMRMAVVLGTFLGTHAIRQRQVCHEDCASLYGNRAEQEPPQEPIGSCGRADSSSHWSNLVLRVGMASRAINATLRQHHHGSCRHTGSRGRVRLDHALVLQQGLRRVSAQ